MAHEAVLVVDDEAAIRRALSELLDAEGYEVETAADGEIALQMLQERVYDLVLADLFLPKLDGMEILQYLVQHAPETVCIIITGHGTIPNAVAAMRLGAYDYLCKPIESDALLMVLDRALEHRRLKEENIRLKKQLKKKYGFDNIVGISEAIYKIFDIIRKVADTDSTILLLGESGTGKELIARAIHYNSERREGPLIAVNCAAIPEELLESELFGHERGAFTHAIRTRYGRFEQANGGTIFLDEIGDMSPNLQVKINRVLQEHQFERIGGLKPIKVNIRVIAATNQDLEKLVQQGRFREDLYYRLNVIPIKIPPLRERTSDIPLLVKHFLNEFSAKKAKKVKGFTPEAMNLLVQYSWPGNVRELENLMERLVILADREILEVSDLPERFLTPAKENHVLPLDIPEEGIQLNEAVSEFERQLIIRALNKTGWVKNQAAQLLHLNRTTLIEKIKKQKISKPGEVPSDLTVKLI
ncbi:MAG: sigma-54-dependent Fis family transcriptional regulator [Deltaproteobacteria bacterium]|nr:sigma-54-dependent Fis family transcriptional regulator [Deltaproteobacteria bacterium]MBW1952413.1 sigma-54-dependent Fis family transcriptional regulator [Deltaproteobacteria bacterium]MBW1986656.1 sigma-54-dependent Fis family transcriptional regulator [Deltaproteobacteria bacterium]MBW2134864.1 sigma-54-dependent Fis family transcriptional regulator [Deltaproteobacteria bacterium]